MEETRGFKERGRKFPPWKVKKKGQDQKKYLLLILEKERANTEKREERKKKKKKKKKITGMETTGVWNLSMDIWFRTLYLVYGLGLGTPKLISCMVELRRDLRLLDTCFEKGPVTSRTQKIPCFRSYAIVES